MLLSKPFVFDGVSSETYNLIIYHLSDDAVRELEFGTNVDIIEERLPKKTSPIHYGVNINQPMTFSITFGAVDYLSHETVDKVIGWLTGHNQYKNFEFEMNNNYYIRLKCMMNNFKPEYINGLPVAFSCDVVCDSQFSHSPTLTKFIELTNVDKDYTVKNLSVHNGYIYPSFEFKLQNIKSINITNKTDNDREFVVSDIPAAFTASEVTLNIDNDNQIISASNSNFNAYEFFNGNFFRLLKGDNDLTLSAEPLDASGDYKCELTMHYEFLRKSCSGPILNFEVEDETLIMKKVFVEDDIIYVYY